MFLDSYNISPTIEVSAKFVTLSTSQLSDPLSSIRTPLRQFYPVTQHFPEKQTFVFHKFTDFIFSIRKNINSNPCIAKIIHKICDPVDDHLIALPENYHDISITSWDSFSLSKRAEK